MVGWELGSFLYILYLPPPYHNATATVGTHNDQTERKIKQKMAVAGLYRRLLPSPPAIEFSSPEGKVAGNQ